MYYKENDDLITEHFRLQKDIKDIQSQIRKLEKTNQMLDKQNHKLKLQLESKNARLVPKANQNNPLNKLLDRNYLTQTLSRASELCEVATGEILKHAKYVTSNLFDNLNGLKTMDTAMLDSMSSSLWNRTDSIAPGSYSNGSKNTLNAGLAVGLNSSLVSNINAGPFNSLPTPNEAKTSLSNINTFRQETFREGSARPSTFAVDALKDFDKANSFLDSTVISNLSSNESILLSDEEFGPVNPTGDFQ